MSDAIGRNRRGRAARKLDDRTASDGDFLPRLMMQTEDPLGGLKDRTR